MRKFFLTISLIFLAIFSFPTKSFAQLYGEPVKIIIPTVGINLPVAKARIVTDTWEVLNNAASYGENSALPGKSGNTVIFSHAIKTLFGSLPNVAIGTYVYVQTANNTYTYKITDTTSVHSEDLSILKADKESALILYTCEGSADERRFTVRAVLVNVSKSCRLDPLLTKNL